MGLCCPEGSLASDQWRLGDWPLEGPAVLPTTQPLLCQVSCWAPVPIHPARPTELLPLLKVPLAPCHLPQALRCSARWETSPFLLRRSFVTCWAQRAGQPRQVFRGGCCWPVAACLRPGARAEGVTCQPSVSQPGLHYLSPLPSGLARDSRQHRQGSVGVTASCPRPCSSAPFQGLCGARQEARRGAMAQVDTGRRGCPQPPPLASSHPPTPWIGLAADG